MNAATANAINSIALIGMGLWGYFATKGPTAFIPVGFGVVLLAMMPGIAKHNKTIAHIAVTLTLLCLIAIAAMPFPKALMSGDTMKILRSGVMVLTCAFAMVMFIKSFIDARKAREAAAAE